MRQTISALLVALSAWSFPHTSAGQDSDPLPRKTIATDPVVQNAEWAVKWWMPRHKAKLTEKENLKSVDLLWIGDSITHGWENAGKQVWQRYYAKRNPLNLGFSGDRTEHVLWRLQNGEVDGISPKLIIIMIGTNNTGHRQDAPEVTAGGISAIIDELRTRLPESKLLLLGIFPRGEQPDDPLRMLNSKINDRLKLMADGERVIYKNINEVFLDDSGKLPKSIMQDLLHPGADGYQLWADAIEPTVAMILEEN